MHSAKFKPYSMIMLHVIVKEIQVTTLNYVCFLCIYNENCSFGCLKLHWDLMML
jgi:hypothetical protein